MPRVTRQSANSSLARQEPMSPVTMSIDFGSTSTRAALQPRHKNSSGVFSHGLVMVEPSSEQMIQENHPEVDRFQYPSYGNLIHRNWKDHIGVNSFYDVDGCSLKYYLYFLAHDKAFSEYPHFQLLVEHQEDPGFKEKLRQSLVIFFRDIMNDASQICCRLNLVVDRLVLAVPPQFNSTFQEIYSSILMDAMLDKPQFALEATGIEYVTEAQAVAHFLITEKPAELHQAESLLVLDFGGHCMNGCLSVAQCGNDSTGTIGTNTAHYEIKAPFSAPGGGELWSYLFGREAKEQLTGPDGKFDANAWREVIGKFTRMKRSLGSGSNPLFSVRKETGEHVDFDLGLDGMGKLHQRAFQDPLDMAMKEIDEASMRFGKQNLCVVLSGGSLLNDPLRETLFRYTEERAKSILWTKSLRGDQSLFISKGGALATDNRLTVEEFFQRGAAFGIQDAAISGDNGEWKGSDYVLPLFCMSLGEAEYHVLEMPYLRYGMRAKLICNPFYAAQQHGENEGMDAKDCYDLYDLGTLGPGQYSFEVFMNPNNSEEIKVTLDTLADGHVADKAQDTMVYRPTSGGARSGSTHSPSVGYVRRDIALPLYFSVGSNCVLVDDDQLETLPTFTNIEDGALHALLVVKSEDFDVIMGEADAGPSPAPAYQSEDDEDGDYLPPRSRKRRPRR